MSTNKSFSAETSERYSRALYEAGEETSELEKIEADVKNFQVVILILQLILYQFYSQIL